MTGPAEREGRQRGQRHEEPEDERIRRISNPPNASGGGHNGGLLAFNERQTRSRGLALSVLETVLVGADARGGVAAAQLVAGVSEASIRHTQRAC